VVHDRVAVARLAAQRSEQEEVEVSREGLSRHTLLFYT
jgi:hypothetical protein